MDSEIKLSIIIPVYNHEKYIVQAIESVLMQQVNFKYELLIGDDCSTDNSLKLIKQYENREQIKIFARKQNMYQNKIRNALDLRMRSIGKYMIALEGDDYWTDPHKLQKQVDFLDNHPDYIACAHRFQVINENNVAYHDEDFECQFFQDNPYTQETFEKGLMISHVNTIMHHNFFKDSTIEELRLFTDFLGMGGDYLLAAHLILNGKIYCFPDIMSCYRKVNAPHSSSWTSQMERNNTRDEQYRCEKGAEDYLNLNHKISFKARKKATYASAVFKWNRERTKKNFKVITNIIKISGHRFQYSLWLIYLLSARFIKNCLGKKNERVKF